MEVIVIDVDYFDRFTIFQRVWNGIADDRFFVEVDRALVVGMVQLSRSYQG